MSATHAETEETPGTGDNPADDDEHADDETKPADDDEHADDEHADDEAPHLPPGPQSEKEINKARAALEKEDSRHANRIGEILGEDSLMLEKCPLCGPAGFVIPGDPGLQDPLLKAAVLTLMGVEPEPEYAQHPDTQRCETCNGLGDCKTGAQVERGRLEACPACAGRGFTYKVQQSPVVPINQGQAPYTPLAAPAPPYTLPPPPPGWHTDPVSGQWVQDAPAVG